MRVNNSTIAPFVDQKSMVWQQQTFVEHSKYASAIANFLTKKGKKKDLGTLFNDLTRDSIANNFVTDVYCRYLKILYQIAFFYKI